MSQDLQSNISFWISIGSFGFSVIALCLAFIRTKVALDAANRALDASRRKNRTELIKLKQGASNLFEQIKPLQEYIDKEWFIPKQEAVVTPLEKIRLFREKFGGVLSHEPEMLEDVYGALSALNNLAVKNQNNGPLPADGKETWNDLNEFKAFGYSLEKLFRELDRKLQTEIDKRIN